MTLVNRPLIHCRCHSRHYLFVSMCNMKKIDCLLYRIYQKSRLVITHRDSNGNNSRPTNTLCIGIWELHVEQCFVWIVSSKYIDCGHLIIIQLNWSNGTLDMTLQFVVYKHYVLRVFKRLLMPIYNYRCLLFDKSIYFFLYFSLKLSTNIVYLLYCNWTKGSNNWNGSFWVWLLYRCDVEQKLVERSWNE